MASRQRLAIRRPNGSPDQMGLWQKAALVGGLLLRHWDGQFQLLLKFKPSRNLGFIQTWFHTQTGFWSVSIFSGPIWNQQ
jgi:hypothetical protein